MTESRRLTPVIALIALTALLLTLLGAAPADAGSERTYQVTITNLTSGQPMTPFVVSTHSGSTSIFDVGSSASPGLQSLAENGGVPDLASELSDSANVAVTEGGIIEPGNYAFAEIDSTPGKRKLSVAGMLICTNDGFGAIDSVQLNANAKKQVVYGFAYDAGTENNTEDYDDLVPPCDGLGQTGMSNTALEEAGVVHPHDGIQGGADLVPGVHGWTGAVIMVEIELVG